MAQNSGREKKGHSLLEKQGMITTPPPNQSKKTASLAMARQTSAGDHSVGRKSVGGPGSVRSGSQLSQKLSQSLKNSLVSATAKNATQASKIQDLLNRQQANAASASAVNIR